ncbi:MAG TPA: CTP synthase [Patescibacteria group bacterium]|nr:CTP synthase [Patescibacteria group bacterium]
MPHRHTVRKTKKADTKFIFVSGGVISGIGKGITSASIGAILKAKGFSVSPVKVDMYLNQDAGTIRPQEHGEVWVTKDGIETDQDLGHYERFIGENIMRANYVTTGQIYAEVLRKERAFEYNGEDVEAIPHVTDEIIRRWQAAGKGFDFCLIELGGTVGEYQNGIFFEAARIMKLRAPRGVLHIHVAYLPIPSYLGEMKSKPVQQSVRVLNSMGIEPDIVVGRSEVPMDDRRKERVALFCNVAKDHVLSNPDVASIYEVPVILEHQHAGQLVLDFFGIKPRQQDLRQWKQLVHTIKTVKKEVHIAVVGKYFGVGKFQLSDSYVSVIESIKHAAWANKVKPVMHWIDSTKIEKEGSKKILGSYDGIVVPGGFGSRGTEGMVETVRYARENKIPYLGLCYGMQMATIEFARHAAGLKLANTTEVDEDAPHPVIHIMPDQEKKLLNREYGATMRLGGWDCVIVRGTRTEAAYLAGGVIKKTGQAKINERHRHRYEFNNQYRERLVKAGLVIAGTTPDGKLVEIVELKDHPFFVGSQFHPEFQSRPLAPHPLFYGFIKAAAKSKN